MPALINIYSIYIYFRGGCVLRKIFCIIAAIVLLFSYNTDVCAESVYEDEQITLIPAIKSRQVGADAAIVLEPKSGMVLFEQNADQRLPIASTTKIMTAFITLQQDNLDSEFVVDKDAINVEGSSMGLVEGDEVTLRTLAIGMLLSSGNDAANAAAVRISGSIDKFAELMNKYAQDMGLENTSFATPSGLDSQNHYSTARDLAILTKYALESDLFRDICSQYKMRVKFGNPPYERWLTNHNKLLNYYDGTIGVKTGFTKKAGRCLVSAAEKNGATLICVTLNCPDDWNTHTNIYDTFFAVLRTMDLSENIPEISVPVTGGSANSVFAVTYENPIYPIFINGTDVTYSIYVPHFLYAPVTKGQAVGEVFVFLDNKKVATLTLISDKDIPLKFPYKENFNLFDWVYNIFW